MSDINDTSEKSAINAAKVNGSYNQVGFGGGCHWCTEAIFQSIKGVLKVEQGWISSFGINSEFSEGVLIHYSNEIVDLRELINIHLSTHSSRSDHSMRNKYRSAVYYIDHKSVEVDKILNEASRKVVTRALRFREFKLNKEKYLNYYNKNLNRPFSIKYIEPKIEILKASYKENLKKV